MCKPVLKPVKNSMKQFASLHSRLMSSLWVLLLWITASMSTMVHAQSTYFPTFERLSEPVETELQTFHLDTLSDAIQLPWGIAFLPEGNTLLTERDGRLQLYRQGVMDPEPVQGVPEVFAVGQGGLLDIEPHPNVEENGWIYISYSKPGRGGGNTALMRARLDASTMPATLIDQEELFAADPPTRGRVHFAGRIEFDQDGFVYLSIGDRGRMEQSQDLSNAAGNVYRFHDDGRIPDDNPFVDNPDAIPSIFSYGHRNPQGMAMHPETGIIWTHEHGPKGGDEINIIRKGANYGWPVVTYGIDYDNSIISTETQREGMEAPLHYWDPSIAPSGMEFIQGDRYDGWAGALMVGALKYQMLVRVELENGQFQKEERFLEGIGRIRELEMGPDGYLYILAEGPSYLMRLVPQGDAGIE